MEYLIGFLLVILLLLLFMHNKGVPILLFHQVNDQSNCTPEVLESYFKFLSVEKYQTLLVSDLESCYKKGQALPKKSMMLTFDDGYYDNYAIVFPLLKKYNLKAVIFINTLFIADHRTDNNVKIELSPKVNAQLIKKYFLGEDCTSMQYATWNELLEMEHSGLVEIHCHTHRHGMCIATNEIKGVISKSTFVPSDIRIAMNGSVDEGTPIFKNRGEFTTAGFELTKAGLEKFKLFYNEHKGNKDFIKKAQSFIFTQFTQQDLNPNSTEIFERRVKDDISINKNLIDTHLKKNSNAFAWPYGHRSNDSISYLKSKGMEYFFTCKKGTNTRKLNPDFIYRNELRNNTLFKLKILTKVNSNLLIGIFYRWIS
jgi:peptidoglycan/xylan/chitin deacetylase (PgdA/CDA1 family)